MKIAIATVQIPFMTGGAEVHAEMLKSELIKRGHQAEIVTIPFCWWTPEKLITSMYMGRSIDLEGAADLVIAMKFPAFYLKHSNKSLWLLHQHRMVYDLWNTEYSDVRKWKNGEEIKEFITQCDKKYLSEYKYRYTNAQNTSNRLKKYCGLSSEALYHPPLNYELFHCESFGDYIFFPSRINALKRQMLLVEAAKYLKTDAKIVLAGPGDAGDIENLRNTIKDNNLEKRVKYVGMISEEEKIRYYANCLAVYFGAYDEDYGYITLEGMFSEKPVIVHTDSGGPLEFVKDGENGFVVPVDAKKLAAEIDELYINKTLAERLGKRAKDCLKEINMNWDNVINNLLDNK